MEYLLYILEVESILILGLGVLLGILVGALPGLTPTMGVALCIPFTFSLPPAYGLLLLGGIYCGSVYGGAIPSILFNVPGAPASIATTLDGYPLAKAGKARQALELATISSAIGGMFGMVLLLLFAPKLAVFSLQFGPTQSFWLAVFGITVIAAISPGSLSKGLIGGGIGILLSLIGISVFTGTPRFTFGMDALVGGIHVVTMLIGLFAFPQALRLIEGLIRYGEQVKDKVKTGPSSVWQSFKAVWRHPKALGIGSTIGAFVGILPGAGGNVASLVAYNEARRFSRNSERFGTGHKEGLISAESANNAMVGGSLVPLLILGIPGSPTAAIFLGGLLIHGIWPGQSLFVEHAPVAYSFLYGMLLAQAVLLALGLLTIGVVSKLVRIPHYFMAPVILSFSIIGAYATQNNLFDVYAMVIIGLVMYVLAKYGFSPAPIALGFILGPIAEVGLLQGLQIGRAEGSAFLYFVSGMWNVLLISLIVLTIALSVWKARQNKRPVTHAVRAVPVSWTVETAKRSLRRGRGIGWAVALILILVSLLYVIRLPKELSLLPMMTLLALFILAGCECAKSMRETTGQTELVGQKPRRQHQLTFVIFTMFISLVCLLTPVLGFYMQVLLLMVSVPLFVYLRKNKNRKANSLRIMVVSASFTLVLYLVFGAFIRVPLPAGVFSGW
ncbi:tripartite tricarboxylate transporter permease [Caldalkalibacillus uzonensis]|nr:tripartite tricarboxylate transporter permease [Caldalkalibacillus uzonensis]